MIEILSTLTTLFTCTCKPDGLQFSSNPTRYPRRDDPSLFVQVKSPRHEVTIHLVDLGTRKDPEGDFTDSK